MTIVHNDDPRDPNLDNEPNDQTQDFQPDDDTGTQDDQQQDQPPDVNDQQAEPDDKLDPIERAIRESLEAGKEKPKQTKETVDPNKPPKAPKLDKDGKPVPPQQQQKPQKDGITLQDGTFIPNGLPRRLYHGMQDARREANQHKQRLTEVEAELRAHKELQSSPQRLGLDVQEAGMAMNLFANWKKNPVGTLQYMLAEAQRMGYSLEGQPNDVGVVARLLDERLKPITQQFEQQRQMQQAEQEAIAEANAFLETYPDARVHESVLARMMRDDERLTPETAYWKLKAAVAERGLDWNRPLSQQVQRGGQQRTQQRPQYDDDNPVAPPNLPRSRPRPGAVSPFEPASDDLSTKDIVREEMRRAGYNV